MTLHSLMVYGMALAKNTVGAGTTSWSYNARYLAFRERLVDLVLWKGFFKDLTMAAEKKLALELLFQKDGGIPGPNLWQVKDDQR